MGQLEPWPREEVTSRIHVEFDEGTTSAFVDAVKARGISVSNALSAAQMIGALDLLRGGKEASSASTNDETPPAVLAQLNVTSMRPLLTGTRRNTLTTGAEGIITAADSTAWNQAMREGPKPSASFWSIAAQIQDFVAKAREDPSEIASKATHDLWTKFNAAADSIAKGKREK